MHSIVSSSRNMQIERTFMQLNYVDICRSNGIDKYYATVGMFVKTGTFESTCLVGIASRARAKCKVFGTYTLMEFAAVFFAWARLGWFYLPNIVPIG